MPATARVPLGASTLNRKWWADVNTGTSGSPVWTPINGITDFKDSLDPQTQDDSDFDSNGWGSKTKTGNNWSLDLKVARKTTRSDPTMYDPGQEFLRLKAVENGGANTVEIRWYEMSVGGPRAEAHQGLAAVSYSPDGGDQNALGMASLTLDGQGQRFDISHPDTAAVAAPTVTSVLYSTGTTVAAAGGGLVIISGTNFGTVTIVTVFGNVVPVADWEKVPNADAISIKVPAHAAGTGNITVTNPGGTSGTSAANQIVYV